MGIGQGACSEDCRAEHCRSRLHELIDADLLEGGDGEGVLVGVRVTVRVRVRVRVGVRVRARVGVRVRVGEVAAMVEMQTKQEHAERRR